MATSGHIIMVENDDFDDKVEAPSAIIDIQADDEQDYQEYLSLKVCSLLASGGLVSAARRTAAANDSASMGSLRLPSTSVRGLCNNTPVTPPSGYQVSV